MQLPVSLSGIVDVLRFWDERKNQIEFQYIGFDYCGAEIDPNTNDLLVAFALQFDLANISINRSEDISYSFVVEEPPREGETRPSTHSYDSIIFERLESNNSYEPLMVRTDFSNYMIITNDHPRWIGTTNQIHTRTPFTWDITLRMKTTSSTHRGDTNSWPILTFLMEWVRQNEGKTLEEVEQGLRVAWEREIPSQEQMEMVIGEDFTLPPS